MKVTKVKAVAKLDSLIRRADTVVNSHIDAADFKQWRNDCVAALRNIFGADATQTKSFFNISFHPFMISMGGDNTGAYARAFRSGFTSAVAALRANQAEIQDYWPDTSPELIETSMANAVSKNIFIVHGRDLDRAEVVARLVEKRGFVATILHEQPNQGKTLVEKFEAHAAPCAFAIVLLTPDDEGRLAGDSGPMRPRARQNVILEMGFFLHALGRARVAILYSGGVELPSDISGIIYISFDESNWRTELEREMRAAGLQ